jgi:hypothetical protein
MAPHRVWRICDTMSRADIPVNSSPSLVVTLIMAHSHLVNGFTYNGSLDYLQYCPGERLTGSARWDFDP